MNERKILEKSIEEHQAAIDTAKGKLAELDKPKLRHGDYGYSCQGEFNIALLDDKRSLRPGLKLFNEEHILLGLDPQTEIKTVIGNIFDDLKQIKDYHQKRGQLIATAKRDK